jgi:hypothetical protein
VWPIRSGGSTGEKSVDGRRQDRDSAAAATWIPGKCRWG